MNKKYVIGGGIGALAVVVFAVWFLFFKDDAPDAVDLGDANDQLDADLAASGDGDGGEDGDGPVPTGIDGVWAVDDEIGTFDFETASGSFAGFRVAEELTIGETTAVGRSGGVTGSVTIDDGQLVGADVTVDMTSIVSNDPRRESAIRRAINASEFPTATFTFDGGVDVSAIEPGGDPQSFTVEGELTVGGVTNPVTFAIDANVRDDGFGVIVGSTELVWEDFDITPPSASIVVSVADEGTVEFQLIVAR
ncbi:MAG: YceI family protein [Acidimicrobiales bacterium]|nr:YceI family protein [Acidimicrobiales bacterium]